jgi:DNA replication protein DnaC
VNNLLHKEIHNTATQLRLPTIARQAESTFVKAGHQEALATLAELLQMECGARQGRRVDRLRAASHLPEGKTLSSLEKNRLPRPVVQSLNDLTTGAFAQEAVNVLAFGMPGVGKTHVVAALGHALIDVGIPVYFTPTFRLVQELLVAKKEYALPKALKRLERFDVLILDDIGYVQQAQEEMEVLFTLLDERYERASTIITSNLVFSQWEQIFKNPLTTAAAIDRVVHHSVILEFGRDSYRNEVAEKRAAKRVRSAEIQEREVLTTERPS